MLLCCEAVIEKAWLMCGHVIGDRRVTSPKRGAYDTERHIECGIVKGGGEQ